MWSWEIYDFSLKHLDQTEIENKNSKAFTIKAIEQFKRAKKQGRSLFKPVSLSEEEISQLVDFIYALTDPCVKDPECLMPWVATDSDSNPDGKIIHTNF